MKDVDFYVIQHVILFFSKIIWLFYMLALVLQCKIIFYIDDVNCELFVYANSFITLNVSFYGGWENFSVRMATATV